MFDRRKTTGTPPVPSAAGWGVFAPPAPGADNGMHGPPPEAIVVESGLAGPPPHPAAPDQQVVPYMEHLEARLAAREAEVKDLKDLIHDLARGLYPQLYQQHIDADPDWRRAVGVEGWKAFFVQGRASRPPPVSQPPSRPDAPPAETAAAEDLPDSLPDTRVVRTAQPGAGPPRAESGSMALREDGGMGEPFPDLVSADALKGSAATRVIDPAPALPSPEEGCRLWAVHQLHGGPAGLLSRLQDPNQGLGRVEETEWGGLIVPGADWPGRDRHPWTLARAWWPEQRLSVHMLLIWWSRQSDPDQWRLPRDAHETACHLWNANREIRHGILFLQGCGSAAEYGALCTRAMEYAVTLTCILPSGTEARELTRHFVEVLGEKAVKVISMSPPAGDRSPARAGEEQPRGPA